MAGARPFSLEMDSLRVELDRARYKGDNLLIRSPVDGVLIAGDLDRSEGVPVARRQALFDVAPIDSFKVHVAIPAADIRHINPGVSISLRNELDVRFRLADFIERIKYSARTHERRNVFVTRAAIDGRSLVLRPCMRSKLRVDAATRLPGFVLFHRPVGFIHSHLPW